MYRKILDFSKRLVPKISETESIALNSGTTSVEKYFFKGSIPKNHIKNTYVYPKLNPSSIINTSVNELCASVDDYNTYQTKNVDDSDTGVDHYDSVIILGEAKKLDEHLEWRLKIGYRGVVVSGVTALLSFILTDFVWEDGFQIITGLSTLIGIAFLSMILYKNIFSFYF